MKITENLLVGLTAIFSNKLRSFLTMLGIVVGVAAVVGTIAIGEGARTGLDSRLRELADGDAEQG